MTTLQLLERVAVVKERGDSTLRPAVYAPLLDTEAVAAGVRLLQENTDAIEALKVRMRRFLASWPERLKPGETAQAFEALLDIVVGTPLQEWRERYKTAEATDAEA